MINSTRLAVATVYFSVFSWAFLTSFQRLTESPDRFFCPQQDVSHRELSPWETGHFYSNNHAVLHSMGARAYVRLDFCGKWWLHNTATWWFVWCTAQLEAGMQELLQGSIWQGAHWADTVSSFASSLSEVVLTKQHFEFSLPAGRCRSSEEESQEAVHSRWILEAGKVWRWSDSAMAGPVFSVPCLAGRLLHLLVFIKLLYDFCCLALLHAVERAL